ncbi:MAG: mgtC [Burkholderiaceae bacterium]|nr:mgtC [Burkholderiaceae bacterium]
MDATSTEILINLVAAVIAGGLIGLERSYFARPAGFRTHAIVCMASSLLMTYSAHQWGFMHHAPLDAIKSDPVRLAQGILSGIGFIGAGAIIKSGLSISGLTTAASIWVTASIGILIGVGFYMPAAAATILTLIILGLFPWIEDQLPSRLYIHSFIRFKRSESMDEADVRELMHQHNFRIISLSFSVSETNDACEYKMLVRTSDEENISTLAEHLRITPRFIGYGITPSGD